MTPTVAIVDLGLGNLRSVARALQRAGASPSVVSEPEDLRGAERIVVPGQGAFRDGARALSGGLGDALREALERGTPYLGICLGMQLLFEGSDEAPGAVGLGCFRGTVRRFEPDLRDPRTGDRLKVPHVGWNFIEARHPVLPASGWFYFAHSYVCVPLDPGDVAAEVDYGGKRCAAVARDAMLAVQFHPEKSADAGRLLMAGFLGVRTGGGA